MSDSLELRKAAILLATLDPHTADALLRQMDDRQCEQLRRALAQLGEVDVIEQVEVAAEFLEHGPQSWISTDGGVEFAAGLAEEFCEPVASSGPDGSATVGSDRVTWPFLEGLSIAALGELLEEEHPQTIAVVVSLLSADRAAATIAQLSSTLQGDVVRRLVELDQAQPDVAREIVAGLERRHRQRHDLDARRSARLTAVQQILEAADGPTGRQIRGHLAQHATQVAYSLGQSELAFGDLLGWDDAALWKVLAAAEPDWVLLAVAGADTELATRILQLLPADEQADFRQALAELGPTRLSDIEEAQRRIAELACQIAFADDLPLPGGPSLERDPENPPATSPAAAPPGSPAWGTRDE